jgi:glycosyltransferase involved in cell wall biosynthesis
MKTLAAIPCYNEEIAIGSVVLKARKQVDEILVVDDGSTDATAEIAREMGAKIISHNINEGKGAAIKSALGYVTGDGVDIFVLLDGDGQHDPNQIPSLIKPLKDGNADIAIGFRSLKQMPFYRRIGRIVLDYTTGIRGMATDSQSGFRALNRRAFEALKPENLQGNGFSIESEMILAAKEQKLRIQEVPITCNYGNGKTSTKNPVSHGFGVLGSIIQLIAEKRPLVFIGIPGLVMIMIGFFFGLKLLQLYNQSGYFSMPFTMLAGFFIILGAFEVFMGLVLNVISRLVIKKENGRGI